MYVRLPIFNDEGMDTGQTAVLPVQALPKGAWWIETRKEEDNGHNGDLADHPDHRRDNRRSDVHLRPEVAAKHHHHSTGGRWPTITCCEEDHP